MRPLLLEVEGLASLRERQTINFSDFEPLAAIVGPTGSGKTTTLDAICLALFGRLPRMDRSVRDFTSLGMNRTRVAYEFLVDGAHYRVVRSFTRKGLQEASVERIRPDGSVQQLAADGGVAAVSRKIEDILGLDYETFSRVILLPQGAFAELLQGGAKERRAILTRLLGVGRFERAGFLARKRGEERRIEADGLMNLLVREYGSVTPARHTALLEEVESIGLEIDRLDAAMGVVQKEWAALKALEARGSQAAEVGRRLENLENQLQEVEQQWATLTRDAAGVLAAHEAAEGEVASASARLTFAEEACEALRTETGGENRVRDIRKSAERFGAVVAQAHVIALDMARAESRLKDAEAKHAAAADVLSRIESDELSARASQASAHDAVHLARSLVAAARARTAALESLKTTTRVEAEAEAYLRSAEVVVATLEQQSRETAAARDDALRNRHIDALVEHLHVGDACPVCAHTIESVPAISDPDVVLATERATEAQQRVIPALQALKRAQQMLSDARSRHMVAREAADSTAGAPDVPEATTRMEHAESDARAADIQVRGVNEARQRAAADSSEANNEVGRASSERALLGTALTSLSSERDTLHASILSATGGKEPDVALNWSNEVLEQIRTLDLAVQSARSAVTAAQANLLGTSGAFRAHERLQSQIEHTMVTLWERLASVLSLEGAETQTAGVSEQVVLFRDRVAAERATAVKARDDVANEYKEARSRIRKAMAGAGVAADLKDPVGAVEQAMRDRRDRRSRLQAEAEIVAGQLARRLDLIADHARVRDEAERYRQLGAELKSDRFIKYVLDESFQELAFVASEELELLSDGRYGLRSEGDAFTVVDHANAEEERSVVTLSGGESFMASLALAVALTKGIRDIAGDVAGARLESVFIDEGFGTLDPATLDTVIDGLERLQQTGRTIVVITHVAEMAERIPSGLEVIPGPRGSTVRPRRQG